MTSEVIAMPSAARRIGSIDPLAPAHDRLVAERVARFTSVHGAELRSVPLFFGYAFLLLVCYYVLKSLREPLLLVDGTAELKSYAQAAIALVLLVLVPAYGVAYRRAGTAHLVRGVTTLFAASLCVLYLLGSAGVDIGFAYYVWVGVFGVTMLAQFWAHAAHCFDVASGQRLFPVVMAGATLGGFAGPPLVKALFPLIGPWNLLLLALALLLATLPLVAATRSAVPAALRQRVEQPAPLELRSRNGFGLVARDRYLLSLAALVVVLNCVNTTGEYLLTHLVLQHVDAQVALTPALDKGALIAAFYGDYYLTVNAITAVLQVFVVGRVFRWLGVHGAVLVLPIIALVGYGLIVFVPVFGLIRLVKVFENGVDYSLMNTVRHALYLPLPAGSLYQGKTAIDGFFFRFGDLVQAAVIYAGLNWFGFEVRDFATLNFALAFAWLAIAVSIARRYRALVARETHSKSRGAPWRAATALGLAAATAASSAAADPQASRPAASDAAPAALFATDAPLELELSVDFAKLCKNPEREGCEDAPATLVYEAGDGRAQSIVVRLRSRGRWRKDTSDCRLPALFVFFADARTAAGTPFAEHAMLPLTTHCREASRSYEQYVLKEYLAYRILNLLTDKSLRVRLARIAYRDTADPERVVERYGFFTEHFDSLAARHAAEVWRPAQLDLRGVDAEELATLALFEFMIGNTDWSVIYGHNVVAIRDGAGAASVVPYDFDFSGLVEAEYAGPPPGLPIRSVRERIYRGVCEPRPDWDAVFAAFTAQRAAIVALVDEIPDLDAQHRRRVLDYLESFFAVLDSDERRASRIVAACRSRS
jgi:AAA family ATP:ADP antiporter